MQRKHLIVAIAAGLGLAGAIAYAANRGTIVPDFGFGADHVANPQPNASTTVAASGGSAASKGGDTRTAKPAPPPTDADVGDAASFGRNVRWLGLTAAYVQASTDCPAIVAEDPGALCQQITNLAVSTPFAFNDIASIKLPANATNSLLCHWFSPRVAVTFFNPTASPVPGRYSYNPTLTVENPVLNDPAMIDATTGLPFNGKLSTSMSASESVQVVVDPAIPISQNLRDSVVCQAGLLSKKALVETYGLTATQANSFFANPTTVRLNVSGSSRFVDYALYSFGLRIVGD